MTLTGASTPKDLSPADGGPTTNTSVVKVAMVSTTLPNWQKIGGDSRKRENSPLVDVDASVPSIPQDLADSSTLGGLGDSAGYFIVLVIRGLRTSFLCRNTFLVLGKIRNLLSDVWKSLDKFARKECLTAVVVT